MYTTIVVEEDPSHRVFIYGGDRLMVRQPYNPNGQNWESKEQAQTWALERAQEGIETCNWPPFEEEE